MKRKNMYFPLNENLMLISLRKKTLCKLDIKENYILHFKKLIVNNKETVRLIDCSGCDLNSPRRPSPDGSGGEEARDNCTPLHLCCQWGLEQVVQTLIEHGAAVNARDTEGKTPVHIAIQNQHSQIISLLLCHPNIDLSLRDKKGLSPFATALTVRNNKAAQAILDRVPTAAEQFDNKGRNFLHTAIQKCDMESILFLLSIQVNRVSDRSFVRLSCIRKKILI